MKITPLDIKKQEFGRKFRGYVPEEVQSYLDMLAGEFEDLLKKNLEYEEEISSLENKLANYTKLENVLQDTLVTTQKSAEDLKSAAEKKAGAIIDEARITAEKMLLDARADLLNIQREIEDLKHQRDSFIISFKSLLDTQQSMLEILEKKGKGKTEFETIKMRTDLSDADLERVVDEFQKELTRNDRENSRDDGQTEGESH